MVPILTVVILRKAPHWIIWPAAMLALIGIFLLSGGAIASLTYGDAMTIVCAFFWSVQVFLIGIFASRERPTAALVCLAIRRDGDLRNRRCHSAGTDFMDRRIQMRRSRSPMQHLSSGLAFSLQVIGQRYTTAAAAAIFLSSEALFAATFGALILGERSRRSAMSAAASSFSR